MPACWIFGTFLSQSWAAQCAHNPACHLSVVLALGAAFRQSWHSAPPFGSLSTRRRISAVLALGGTFRQSCHSAACRYIYRRGKLPTSAISLCQEGRSSNAKCVVFCDDLSSPRDRRCLRRFACLVATCLNADNTHQVVAKFSHLRPFWSPSCW